MFDRHQPAFAQIARAAAEVQRLRAQMLAALAPSQEAVRRIAADVAGLTAVSRRLAEQLRPALLQVQRVLIDPDLVRRLHDALDSRQKEAAAILAEKGWWLAPDFPLPLLNAVVRLKESGRGRRINRFICDYYTHRRLLALVRGWDSELLFQPRHHLFLEALWAHRQGRWYLSIPLLLTQIEGILQDFGAQTGLPNRTPVKKIARELHLETRDFTRILSATWQAQLDEIFGSGYYKTEHKQQGLRRNAILHGLELRYASEVRSLQLFLQLDTIHWLITEKAKNKAA